LFEEKDLIKKIEQALDYATLIGRTKGRERIISLGLDSESVSKRIVQVYETVINSKQ